MIWHPSVLVVLGLSLAVACEREQAPAFDAPPELPERTAPQAEQRQGMQGMQGMQGVPGALPGADSGAARVSDGELEQYARTQLKLANLQGALQAEVKQGKDPNLAQQDYQRQAGQVVAESGLSFERYQNIAQSVAEDPTLKARLHDQLEPTGSEPTTTTPGPSSDTPSHP